MLVCSLCFGESYLKLLALLRYHSDGLDSKKMHQVPTGLALLWRVCCEVGFSGTLASTAMSNIHVELASTCLGHVVQHGAILVNQRSVVV